MPSFLVKVVKTASGGTPDESYADGIIVEARGSYEAVDKANAVWRSRKLPGEVYEITPCAASRIWHVSHDGLLCSPRTLEARAEHAACDQCHGDTGLCDGTECAK